jgi:hypothetical protein
MIQPASLLSIPLGLAEEFDHRRITVIEKQARPRIEGSDRFHVLVF